MFVSVGVREETNRDLQRIEQVTSIEMRRLLRICAAVIVTWLKFDPQLVGEQPTTRPIRKLQHGPLIVFYHILPSADRYAEVIGWSFVADWEM